jgi:ribose transport system ATP-binding protein
MSVVDVNPVISPRLEMRGISKRFPGVKALDDVSFDIRAGEVHALVGENGAGKSTLMKLLAGHIAPDTGEILLDGSSIALQNPEQAKKLGIALVHQEISLIPGLSVAENICLGRLPLRRFGRVNWRRLREYALAALNKLGCEFHAFDIVAKLSVANQQLVEIARALAFRSTVVIFDEPTASLTSKESEALFSNIRTLRQDSVAIVYISHKMDEIFKLADRITILRDGKFQGTFSKDATTPEDVTRRMIGREVREYFTTRRAQTGREILRVVDIGRIGKFEAVNLTVRAGEIVGMYGLVGSGRSEIAEAIFGIGKIDRGSVFIDGVKAKIDGPEAAIQAGIALVPENRKEQGLFLTMGSQDNMILSILKNLENFGFLNDRLASSIYLRRKDELSIAAKDHKTPVAYLSGGNQQKILIAKWLNTSPRLLILDEPTKGIDVGAKAEVHKLIGELASNGLAVLLISSEMIEIMGLSDRIVTLYHGRVTGEFDAATSTEEQIVTAITTQQ